MAEIIKSADNFEELYRVIKCIGPIRGTQETYSPQRLKDLIFAVRAIEKQWTVRWKNPEGQMGVGTPAYMAPELKPPKGSNFFLEDAPSISFDQFEEMSKSGNSLSYVTRTYGLRDKVKELLEKKIQK